MGNPRFLFCDTDALFQILQTKQVRLLHKLSSTYSIKSIITPEVEAELHGNRKLRHLSAAMTKAIGNGTLNVLDGDLLISHFAGSSTTATAVHGAIQQGGAQFSKRVGRGEAYTFAAASTLNMPALSNDMSAIRTLNSHGYDLPSPILRFFDLVTFGHQIGLLTESDCDKIRQELHAHGEGIPKSFDNVSFRSGLTQFCCRLLDGTIPPIGAPIDSDGPSSHKAQLIIVP